MLIQSVEKTVAGGSRGKTQTLLPSGLGVAQAEIIKVTKKKILSQVICFITQLPYLEMRLSFKSFPCLKYAL